MDHDITVSVGNSAKTFGSSKSSNSLSSLIRDDIMTIGLFGCDNDQFSFFRIVFYYKSMLHINLVKSSRLKTSFIDWISAPSFVAYFWRLSSLSSSVSSDKSILLAKICFRYSFVRSIAREFSKKSK